MTHHLNFGLKSALNHKNFLNVHTFCWQTEKQFSPNCTRVLYTRLHSSRMRTAHTLTVSPSMLCAGGVSAPGGCLLQGVGGVYSGGVYSGGVYSQGGVCSGGCLLLGGVCSRGCLLQEGVCSRGVSAPGGCLLQGGVCSRGVSAPGGCLLLGGVCSQGCLLGGCLLPGVVSQHAL